MIRRSSFLRIDDNVFFTMGGVLLFSLVVVAFKVATHTECKPITVIVKDIPYSTGELIVFKADTKDGKSYEWDFGDGSPVEEKAGATVRHAFTKAGKFTISVLVNGKCSQVHDIFINEKTELPQVQQEMTFVVDQPKAFVNAPITFTDTISSHYKWEWYTVESESMIGAGKVLIHSFSTTGRKDVWVKINGTDKRMTYTVEIVEDEKEREKREMARMKQMQNNSGGRIVVIPEKSSEPPIKALPDDTESGGSKIEQTPAAPVQHPAITTKEMGKYIEDYNDHKIEADFFDKFFCGSITVSYEKKPMSWSDFLKEVRNIKKGRVRKVIVNFVKDETNCVTSMNVTIKENFHL